MTTFKILNWMAASIAWTHSALFYYHGPSQISSGFNVS